MPFDGTPSMSGHDKLRRLSALLRDRSQWPEEFQWDYGWLNSCAIGLAVEVGLLEESRFCEDQVLIAAQTFDVELVVAYNVFVLLYQKLSKHPEDVTPEEVADAIDALALVDRQVMEPVVA